MAKLPEIIVKVKQDQGPIERMTVNGAIELRARDDDFDELVGYGAVFNSYSEDLGGFVEIITPGTFAESLDRGDDVRALVNHDPTLILGRTESGTLRLAETNSGLRYEVDPPDTSYSQDLLVSVARGDISQSSFGFMVENRGDDEWFAPGEWNAPPEYENLYLRKLYRAKLYDVSPVTFPAYPATSVSARALEKYIELSAGTQASAAEVGAAAAKGFLLRRKYKHNHFKRFGRK